MSQPSAKLATSIRNLPHSNISSASHNNTQWAQSPLYSLSTLPDLVATIPKRAPSLTFVVTVLTASRTPLSTFCRHSTHALSTSVATLLTVSPPLSPLYPLSLHLGRHSTHCPFPDDQWPTTHSGYSRHSTHCLSSLTLSPLYSLVDSPNLVSSLQMPSGQQHCLATQCTIR